MTPRARSLFPAWFDPAQACPALRAVAIYAAQNPGFDPRDYGPGPYYRADQRRAGAQLTECRTAILGALSCTDADIIEAARGGRVEVTRVRDGSLRVGYTAGQYHCTEFRGAIARVLEAAGRIAYQRTLASVPLEA